MAQTDGPTDGPTDGRTDTLIKMPEAYKKKEHRYASYGHLLTPRHPKWLSHQLTIKIVNMIINKKLPQPITRDSSTFAFGDPNYS